MTLPSFRYHPDPLGSGSIVESAAACLRCGEQRGYIYTGPVYAEEELADSLCPWCIADGTAHSTYDATFVDTEAFPSTVPAATVSEISERTPGHAVWQSEEWPPCCNDATAFITPAGIAEIRKWFAALEDSLLSHIVYNMSIPAPAAAQLLESLDRDRGPTAYLFQCLHCGEYQFTIDTH